MMADTPSFVPWSIIEGDYELRDVIGVGSTAVVYRAFCKPRNEKCAIKMINLNKWSTTSNTLMQKIKTMDDCHHETIVDYYTSFIVKDDLWLVLRLLEGGSLLDVIKHKMQVRNCKHGVFDEPTIATVLKEVLRSLEYLHSMGHAHRDIKAGNILLAEDGSIQLADFGMTSWLGSQKDDWKRSFTGTPCWMAPEILKLESDISYEVDIWAFGITAIEMAAGNAPYHKHPPMKVLKLILLNDPPTLDTGAEDKNQYKAYGIKFRKMINLCLKKDPNKRPSAKELLQHPFFAKARDKKYLTQILVAIGPSMEIRVHKASKRKNNPAEYLHRTAAQEWVWTDEDDDGSVNSPVLAEDNGQELDEDSRKYVGSNIEIKTTENVLNVGEPPFDRRERPPELEPHVINLVLRMRNSKKQLHDIKFDFVEGKDSAERISSELVAAGLAHPKDSVPISLNLMKLLLGRHKGIKAVTFHLNSTGANELFNDKSLLGFALIFISRKGDAKEKGTQYYT